MRVEKVQITKIDEMCNERENMHGHVHGKTYRIMWK